MLQEVHAVMPAVTQETGVTLRFLAAIRRTPLTIVKDNVAMDDYFRENLRVLRAVAGDPYVAGSDIIGEEINDIRELEPVIREIVHIQMGILQRKLEDENVRLTYTRAFEDDMVENGYDPVFGARPVKRLIQRELVNKLAREILEGKIRKDSAIEVDCVDGQTVLRNC